MTRRVILDDAGLKVAKSGYDADTASALNLQFSSDFSHLAFYRTAEINCDWNETGFRSYSLGKTFPTPPIVHLQKVTSTNDVWEAGAVGHLFWEWRYDWTDLDGNANTAQHTVNIYVTTSALQIKSINFSTKPAQFTPPLFRLRYTVMDYNL